MIIRHESSISRPMEPFNITFHEVTSLDEDADVFGNVVNYDLSFSQSDQSLPLNAYNVNTVQYTWKDLTPPSTTVIQTTNGGIPTGQGSTVQHFSVWQDGSCRGLPHLSFLVHPDDHLGQGSSLAPTSPTVSQEELKTLSQITANTSAASRISKRPGQKILVARTRTSPSTPIPPPFASSMSQLGATPSLSSSEGQGGKDTPSGSVVGIDTISYISADPDVSDENIEDNSFETVAEALKLQWSVIGNKSLAPAPPDVVAQIVAEAEKKLKGGSSQTSTPRESPNLVSVMDAKPVVSTPVSTVSYTSAPLVTSVEIGRHPQQLTRIIPTEITVERPNSGTILSHALQPASTTTNSNVMSSSNSNIKPDLVSSKVSQSYSSPRAEPKTKSGASTVENKNIPEPSEQKMRKDVQKTPKLSTSGSQVDILDTISEASYSSEAELEKYSSVPASLPAGINTSYELESEEFLRSLPPIKPINLDEYTTPPISLPPYFPVSKTKPSAQNKATGQSNPDQMQTKEEQQKQTDHTPLSSESPTLTPPASNGDQGSMHYTTKPVTASPSLGGSHSQREFPGMAKPPSHTVDKKRYERILKEKAKLQGQLEILTSESHTMLQERAELQSLLASLQAKVSASTSEESTGLDVKSLHKEVLGLRESRHLLEQTVLDANRLLSEKAEELRTIQDELQSVQDQTTKFQVRVQELKDDIRAKDMNTQALKNKIAELYVEVQTSIQAKMEAETEARTARNDLTTLVKAKEWYQEQLQLAHDVRSKLQREITVLQAQAVSHGTIVERLKTESGRLRQQLSDVQQKALHDKEALARHLEGIQNDMMEREAAFLEIQRERKLYEDTFNSQVITVEEEKSRLAALQQATSELEGQLDRAHGEAKKRHEQLLSMENGQMESLKKLTLAGENLSEKDKVLEEMEQKLIQVENQLQAAISDLSKKDSEILSLKEERACTEIALKSALQEKASVDKALDVLKADMGKVEQSFKQMKQELTHRLTELDTVKGEKEKLQEELDRSQHELDIKSRSVDSLTRSFEGQNATHKELASEKGKLRSEMEELSRKVQLLEAALEEKEKIVAVETEKVQSLTSSMANLQSEVDQSKNSLPADKVEIYEAEIDALRNQIKALEEVETEEATELEEERNKLKKEIERLKEELTERQQKYEENVTTLDSKLKEMGVDKQQLETELGIARRSLELSEMEAKESFTEEIQGLSLELTSEKKQKQNLEEQLTALQAQKAFEIEALQSSLEYQTKALQAMQTQMSSLTETEEVNERLELELEKEKGKVIGLTQKNQELKDHSHQLEAALAQRESCLEELRRTVEDSQQGLEERESKFKSRISNLEAAVEKEVAVQKDIRKQMGVKIMESKRLKKHQESAKVEIDQLKQDLFASQQMASQAGSELEMANQKSQAVQREAMENAALARTTEAELERVKRDLAENLVRYPVLQEQIQSLEWQSSQKSRELESAMEQIKLVEARGQEEVEAVKATLLKKQSEIEDLHTELSSLRQEKTHQRSQVTELRGALKASVQHHQLTQRLNENVTDKGTQANLERKIMIPPLPFELSTIEKLLQETRVTPLESKPLDQLSSCLTSLRAEISGLQKHMDLHTTAVNSSRQSAESVESTVNDLNEVMRTIANTIIAANSTKTITMATAVEREQGEIINV